MQLTAEMKQAIEQEHLGFVATVRPDGTPALSPKGPTSVWRDSQLVFLHIHSEGTVMNLAANPAMEINVVNPITRKGWRFRGRATVHPSGRIFEEVINHFAGQGRSSAALAKAVVIMDVDAADLLLSPAYDDGSSEEEIVARWRPRWQARLDRLPTSPNVDPRTGQGY